MRAATSSHLKVNCGTISCSPRTIDYGEMRTTGRRGIGDFLLDRRTAEALALELRLFAKSHGLGVERIDVSASSGRDLRALRRVRRLRNAKSNQIVERTASVEDLDKARNAGQ